MVQVSGSWTAGNRPRGVGIEAARAQGVLGRFVAEFETGRRAHEELEGRQVGDLLNLAGKVLGDLHVVPVLDRVLALELARRKRQDQLVAVAVEVGVCVEDDAALRRCVPADRPRYVVEPLAVRAVQLAEVGPVLVVEVLEVQDHAPPLEVLLREELDPT